MNTFKNPNHFHAAYMKYLLKISRHARLATCLCISLLLHLAIIASLSWSAFGVGHASYRASLLNGNHRLTVTLFPSPAETSPTTQVAPNLDAKSDAAKDRLTAKDMNASLGSDLRFFNVAELDQHPVITRDIPDNPPELLEHPQGGEVVLRLWIDETGKVTNIETISSNLPQPFVDSARTGFLQASFSPGRKHGIAVGSVMDVAIRYAPKE